MPLKAKKGIAAMAALPLLFAFFYLTRKTWFSAAKILLLSGGFSLLAVPLCNRLEKQGMRKNAAALLGVLSIALVLFFFLLIFVPYLITGIIDFGKRIAPTLLMGIEQLDHELIRWGTNNSIKTDAAKMFASFLTPITARIAKGGIAFFAAAGHVIFALVIAYYLLTMRNLAKKYMLLLIPLHMRKMVVAALSGCANAVLSYLAGSLKTALFVSTATFVGLVLLGISDALLLAFFMGVLEFLPFIGPFLGALPILLAAIPLGISRSGLAMLLVFFVQQLESGIVGPYFTASSASIHPLTAIIGVFLGGSLFGIPGILLIIPTLIVARSIFWSIRSASIRFDS